MHGRTQGGRVGNHGDVGTKGNNMGTGPVVSPKLLCLGVHSVAWATEDPGSAGFSRGWDRGGFHEHGIGHAEPLELLVIE
jgi:hypothetical protein